MQYHQSTIQTSISALAGKCFIGTWQQQINLLLMLSFSVLCFACGQFSAVPVRQVKKLNLIDGCDKQSLSQSAQRSLTYYERLSRLPSSPEKQSETPPVFLFGEHSYSALEMVASTQLFLNLLDKSNSPKELNQSLQKHFLYFEISNSQKKILFTGYFEPEIPASRRPTKKLNTPVHARPKDLIAVNLNRYENAKLPSIQLYGKLKNGKVQPYDSRIQIQQRKSLKGRAHVIAWVNEVDLFFLQIQGSGTLRFANNKIVRIGYAASNSNPYRSIGAILVEQEKMPLEDVTMQSLKAWIHSHPRQGRELMLSNPSYVFFDVRKQGPLGNIQLKLTPQRSLAVDSSLLPKGALAFVSTHLPAPQFLDSESLPPFQCFMMIQDTGGAIRGYRRGDIFFGSGPEAEWNAGQMKNTGRLFLLVAKKSALTSLLPAESSDKFPLGSPASP